VVSEEIFVPFAMPADEVPLASMVRSTVLLSSQRALRTRGLFDRYLTFVDATRRDQMRVMTAGAWLPVDHALAHYKACDALALDRETIHAIGAESGRFLNETLLTIVAKLSKQAGVTPWAPFAHVNRMAARTWRGASCGVFKLGPKEARVEWIGLQVAAIPYFRVAFAGFIQGIVTLFTTTFFIRELPRYCSATTLGYRCSWV
jgi:hypothetical protein